MTKTNRTWAPLATLFAASLSLTLPAQADDTAMELAAKAKTPVAVMVIGLTHFASPGKDMVNTEAVNVLTPVRQHELAVLSDTLLQFHPTLVAVEQITDAPAYTAESYLSFDGKTLATNPNEVVQIGYRLARAAGLKAVYGIDEQPSAGEPDYFPFDKVQAFLEKSGQAEAFGKIFGGFQAQLEAFAAADKTRTIPATLALINSPDALVSSPELYFTIMEFDRGEDQPGAEVYGYFTMRNAKIFAKLMDVTKPGDRVVVVYGAGHKYFLDQMIAAAPGYRLVDPLPYLRKADAALRP